MSQFTLSAQEGALLTNYVQAKAPLETFVAVEFRFEDLPLYRLDVVDALNAKFPSVKLTSLSPTTCSTLWILGVETHLMKLTLLDAGFMLVKDKYIHLIDFSASNIIEIQLHRVSYNR